MSRSPLCWPLRRGCHRSTSERRPITLNLHCRLSESPVISLPLITANSHCVKTSRTNLVNPLVPRDGSTGKHLGRSAVRGAHGYSAWHLVEGRPLRPENECTT